MEIMGALMIMMCGLQACLLNGVLGKSHLLFLKLNEEVMGVLMIMMDCLQA